MTRSTPNAHDTPGTISACGCPRHAALKPVLIGTGWFAAAVAALSVAAAPFDIGESLCGVWGCFPPLPPLAALHALWVVLLAAGVSALRRARRPLLKPVGVVLIAAALVAAAVVLGGDLNRWLDQMPAEYHPFWLRRIGYTLATQTDLPIVQAAAVGCACLVLGRRTCGHRCGCDPQRLTGRV